MPLVRRVLGFTLVLVLALLVFAGGWLTGRLGLGSVVTTASLPDLERQFAERMRNVTMVGTFTIDGRQKRDPEPDRYEIASVEKVGDNLWRFNAKMDCCGVGGSGVIPIVVPMQFSGDTAMIMMTDTSLPGLGTFTVRVIFYGDRYAGTWQHGDVGGHMSGRIEKSPTPVQ
jgi:hypothetical protein